MKRFLTIAIASCLIASSAMAQTARYGWSVSASPVDPFQNSGTVAPGVATLFLHFVCSTDGGMSAADIGATASAGNVILAYNTANGYLNAGSATALLLAVGGCPAGPVNAGSWLILKNTPLSLCLTGANVTVDCEANPSAWPHDALGFAEAGVPLCNALSSLCQPTSVEDASWGSIKGLYR